MKISQLISTLEQFLAAHGDLPVLVYPGPKGFYTFPDVTKYVNGQMITPGHIAPFERHELALKDGDEVAVIY